MNSVFKLFSLLFGTALVWGCSKAEPTDLPAITDTSAIEAGCRAEPADLARLIQGITAELSAQEILYDSELLSDCSGMFHRVLQAFDERCPGHSLPDHRSARDSRSIGRWYAEKSLFTPITDALAQAALIDDAGTVVGYRLFHGRSPGKTAGITEYQQRDPSRDGLPPLGNWDQQWIGVASVSG